MLGFIALGLTSYMIYNLVKNALIGKQLSKDDSFNETIELIIPVGANSDFFLEAWKSSLSTFKIPSFQLKIHILLDGPHPGLKTWENLKNDIPYLEVHHFPMRPNHQEAIPWMLDQVSEKIQSKIVIIGDPELVPSETCFLSIAKTIIEKNRPYFVIPQTAKLNFVGEALALLSPNLAFVSFYGTPKWSRTISHSLLSATQGWMCMDLNSFKELDFRSIRLSSWKEAISRHWNVQGKKYHLAFGEKLLLRYYPEEIPLMFQQMRRLWVDLWAKKDKKAFYLFLTTIFLWSFPVICFFTHPYWSVASFLLLVMYRFFSKIIFQESWTAIVLHPLACLVWLGTFFMWLIESLKSHYKPQTSSGT
jgi:hypothetical protein